METTNFPPLIKRNDILNKTILPGISGMSKSGKKSMSQAKALQHRSRSTPFVPNTTNIKQAKSLDADENDGNMLLAKVLPITLLNKDTYVTLIRDALPKEGISIKQSVNKRDGLQLFRAIVDDFKKHIKLLDGNEKSIIYTSYLSKISSGCTPWYPSGNYSRGCYQRIKRTGF